MSIDTQPLNMKYTLLAILFIGASTFCFSQEVWTIGPAIHVNFAKRQKVTVSYAVEFAYWNFYNFYHSVDGGLEFERKKIRVYSELQTGFKMGGISCGPVIEFTTNGQGTHLGMQGSLWTNYFISTDLRKRWIDNKCYTSCGVYAPSKLPTSFPDIHETCIVKKLEAYEKRMAENSNSNNDYDGNSGNSWDWD